MRNLLLSRILISSVAPLFALIAITGTFPTAICMFVGGVLLLPVALARGEGPLLRRRLHEPAAWALAACCAIGTAMSASASVLTSVIVLSFLSQLAPIATLLTAPMIAHERPTTRELVAIGLGIPAGVALALAGSRAGGGHANIGILLGLGAVILSGTSLPLFRRQARGSGNGLSAAVMMLMGGGLILLPFQWSIPTIDAKRLGLLAAISVIFALGNFLLGHALQSQRCLAAAAIRPLGAVWGSALAILLLGEHFSLLMVVGAVAAVLSILVISTTPSEMDPIEAASNL